jgi:pyridoxamine 5'-phosphate oxidase
VRPDAPRTLDEIVAALWSELSRASHDKHHAWRTPALATAAADGVDARTVVLREVDAAAQTLRLFSDARAAKVGQLRAVPRALLLMWSPQRSWQLRLSVHVTAQTEGPEVAARWARVKDSPTAQDYLSAQAPGADVHGRTPAAIDAPPAHFFAVLNAQVLAIDWLELGRSGHRRACFDHQGARWLVP